MFHEPEPVWMPLYRACKTSVLLPERRTPLASVMVGVYGACKIYVFQRRGEKREREKEEERFPLSLSLSFFASFCSLTISHVTVCSNWSKLKFFPSSDRRDNPAASVNVVGFPAGNIIPACFFFLLHITVKGFPLYFHGREPLLEPHFYSSCPFPRGDICTPR